MSSAVVAAAQGSSSTSTNAQLRKIKKPLIERRRRERINECLNQLKTLVLEATNKDETRYSKMEKADILEMTVAHLKSVHTRNRRTELSSMSSTTLAKTRSDAGSPSGPVSPIQTDDASTTPEGAALRYVSGYSECMRHVTAFLSSSDASRRLPTDVRVSLVRHLDDCLRVRGLQEDVDALPAGCDVTDGSALSPLTVGNRGGCDQAADFRTTAIKLCVDESDRMAVDAFGTSAEAVDAQRRRCDSGVYSGASSPAQDDEDPMMTSTWDRRDSTSMLMTSSPTPVTSPKLMSSAAWQSTIRSVSLTTSPDVWRPW